MNRQALLLLLFACLFSFSVVTSGEEAEGPHNLKAVELLPGNAVAHFSMPDVHKVASRFLGTGFGKLLALESVRSLIEFVRGLLKGQEQFVTLEEIAVTLYELCSRGGVAAAYYYEDIGGGQPDNVLAVSLHTGKPEKVSVDTLKIILDKFGIVIVEPQKVAGVLVYEITSDFYFFYHRGNLVIVTDIRFTEHILKAAEGANVAGSELHKRVSGHFPQEYLSEATVDLKKLFAVLSEHNALLMPIMEVLGLDRVAALTLTLSIKNGFFHEKLILHNDGRLGGLFRAFRNEAKFEKLNLIPSDSACFIFQNIDWQECYGVLMKLLEIVDPEEYEVFNRSLRETNELLGMDLESNIRDAVDNQACLYAKYPPRGFVPTVAGFIGLKDKNAASGLLDGINAAAPESFVRREWLEYVFYWLKTDANLPFAVGMAIKDDTLLIGNGPMGLKNNINASKKQKPIHADSTYSRLSALLPSPYFHSTYINFKVLGARFFPMLDMLKLMEPEAANIHFPIWADIEPHINGFYLLQRWEGDNIVIESAGDLPLLNLISLLVPAGFAYFTVAGMMEINRDLEQAEELEAIPEMPRKGSSETRLQKIFALLDEYARKHDGQFPKSFDDVATKENYRIFQSPETMSPQELGNLDESSDYFYFSGQKKGKEITILAANKLPVEQGMRFALFSDGSVRKVADDELKKLISEYNKKTGGDVVLDGGYIF